MTDVSLTIKEADKPNIKVGDFILVRNKDIYLFAWAGVEGDAYPYLINLKDGNRYSDDQNIERQLECLKPYKILSKINITVEE